MTFIRSFSKVIRSLCLVLQMYSGKEDDCGLKIVKGSIRGRRKGGLEGKEEKAEEGREHIYENIQSSICCY